MGDLEIDEMFDKFLDVCHDSSMCETTDIEFDSWWMEPGMDANFGPIKVIMGPHGLYPTWIRNGLVYTLKAALKAGARCGEVTNWQTCHGGDKGCHSKSRLQVIYLGNREMVDTKSPVILTVIAVESFKSYQCEIPKFWGISYHDANEGNAAPPGLSTDIRTKPANSELCRGEDGYDE